MAKTRTQKKSASRIPAEIENKILEVSLQHPEYGARRLIQLLAGENISIAESRVYRILKRHGMETRAKRIAKAEAQRSEKPASASRKPPARISTSLENRIVEVSLQNPDCGAQRLTALLKDEAISVSKSSVYSILKRHDLQTRSKRIQKIKESKKEPDRAPKKSPGKISREVEERIVAVSLQNPDLGAKRLLPLLESEDIFVSASAVYNILKRRGLGSRTKRLAALAEIEVVEAKAEAYVEELQEPPVIPVVIPEDEEAQAPEPVQIPLPVEQQIQEPEETYFLPVPVEMIPPPKLLKRPARRFHWLFALFNFLLICLALILGVQAVQNMIRFRNPPPATKLSPVPAPASASVVKPEVKAHVYRPLNDYRVIWERNLFNISNEIPAAEVKPKPIEKLKIASKKRGLKLVGTAVFGDTNQSRAIIDIRKKREQIVFHEGDQIGKIRIKKIQRNKVIITTEQGDELLTLDPERIAKKDSSSSPGSIERQLSLADQNLNQQSQTRRRVLGLTREFVTRFIGDPQEFLQNIKVSPYTVDDQPTGFRITGLSNSNALRQMGLRSGDVIIGINDEAITGPQQAADFLETLKDGGEINIKIKRSRSERLVRLNIQ